MIKAGETAQFILDGPAGTGKIKGANAPTDEVQVPSTLSVTFPTAGRYAWQYCDEFPGTHKIDGGSSTFAIIIVS